MQKPNKVKKNKLLLDSWQLLNVLNVILNFIYLDLFKEKVTFFICKKTSF